METSVQGSVPRAGAVRPAQFPADMAVGNACVGMDLGSAKILSSCGF